LVDNRLDLLKVLFDVLIAHIASSGEMGLENCIATLNFQKYRLPELNISFDI